MEPRHVDDTDFGKGVRLLRLLIRRASETASGAAFTLSAEQTKAEVSLSPEDFHREMNTFKDAGWVESIATMDGKGGTFHVSHIADEAHAYLNEAEGRYRRMAVLGRLYDKFRGAKDIGLAAGVDTLSLTSALPSGSDVDLIEEVLMLENEGLVSGVKTGEAIYPVFIHITSAGITYYREMQKGQQPFPMTVIHSDDLPEENPATPLANGVFIVHGRSDLRHELARFIKDDLGLYPIMLDEQPNLSQALIEKFEKHAQEVGYAVVLLTPDDKGCLATEWPDHAKLRARQNVIFELGYFFAKLGRERVACLNTDKSIEDPSDVAVIYIFKDPHGGWKDKLRKEFREVGMLGT